MLQITPQMRVLVAVEPVDFRRGIDGLARQCRSRRGADPFAGTVFVFRNRRATAVKLLVYDGQGFWLCHKRWSAGHLRYWPARGEETATRLQAHELSVLLRGGAGQAAARSRRRGARGTAATAPRSTGAPSG